MPFVTEELWQRLPRRPGQCDGVESVMLAPWPQVEPSWADEQADADVEGLQGVVKAMRSLRAAYNLVRDSLLPLTCGSALPMCNAQTPPGRTRLTTHA